MSGWFSFDDIIINILIFVHFVVLPVFAMACIFNIAIEEEKIRERRLKHEIQKEAEREAKRVRKEEEEENNLHTAKEGNLNEN